MEKWFCFVGTNVEGEQFTYYRKLSKKWARVKAEELVDMYQFCHLEYFPIGRKHYII